jgi:hypothetical protein
MNLILKSSHEINPEEKISTFLVQTCPAVEAACHLEYPVHSTHTKMSNGFRTGLCHHKKTTLAKHSPLSASVN